eukprot:scaffold552_cov228-Chaetoceros_neogracile.AAC.2
MCCFIRMSCSIQLWLIRHPNCITKMLLSLFYVRDLIAYSINPKKFLQNRQAIFGQNFAALGRIIVGDYKDVTEIIASPQKRAAYLGRARLMPRKFSKNFPLFLSDEGAGGSALHETLHNHFWVDVVPSAVTLIDTKETEFTQYIQDGVKIIQDGKKKQAEDEIFKMTIRYMFHAFFGAPLTEKLVNDIFDLAVGGPLSNQVLTGTKPFVYFTYCFQCSRSSKIKKVMEYIMGSPLLAEYVPGEANGNQDSEDYASMLLDVLVIAATLGTSNLIVQVITGIPDDAEIDLNDNKEVMMAILEAARRKSPVNTVNLVLSEERKFVVNGKEKTIPAKTLVGASIGLASLDGSVFSSPDVYNHKRENLMKAVINFNHLGFDAKGSGTRQCPGRNIAMKYASDILKLSRSHKAVAY